MSLDIGTVTVASGGRIGICPIPGGRRPLDEDLAAIAAWGAAHVVSMTEQREMDACGAGNLGERLRDMGIAWSHVPVRDFGGLDGENAANWPALSRTLHDCLDAGGGVLVHCRAGQGRSGMVVMRLLVERGDEAADALARLRAVRPGAVETDEQFAWASSVGPSREGE